MKLWGKTRWDSRWGAIDAIINNFSAVIKALVDISEEGGGSQSVNAGGLLTHVKKINIYYNLVHSSSIIW